MDNNISVKIGQKREMKKQNANERNFHALHALITRIMTNDTNVAGKGFYLFNREQKPEECDARKDDSSN